MTPPMLSPEIFPAIINRLTVSRLTERTSAASWTVYTYSLIIVAPIDELWYTHILVTGYSNYQCEGQHIA